MELALAVDLGGTKLEVALVRPDGSLVVGSRARVLTGPAIDPERLSSGLREATAAALCAADPDDRVVAAGIGSAGPVDLAAGTISPLNLPRLPDFPIVAEFARSLDGQPIVLARDGICIALAEWWRGAARGADAVLGIVVSTGVGGGILLEGRQVPGASGNAGHIGQVEVGGFTAEGGDPAMLESIASGPSSVAWARERGWPGRTGEELAAASAAGDRVARAAVERSARAVGQAIASAAALVDIDVVVIGGGFSRVAPDYLDLVRASRDRTRHAFLKRARIVPAALGDEAPLIGAAALVLR